MLGGVEDQQIPPHVAEYVQQAIRIALERAPTRYDFADFDNGASIIPALSSTTATSHAPNVVIQSTSKTAPASKPCWSFVGGHGQLGIRLARLIRPNHLGIDNRSGQRGDFIHSPRKIIIWGLVDGPDNMEIYDNKLKEYRDTLATRTGTAPPLAAGYTFIVLSELEYDIYAAYPDQSFRINPPVAATEMYFGVVVVEIRGNWGGNVTELCRVRLHGEEVGEQV
ncbi:hypothetical protein TRAPUB_6892 [Trametes pubescens]|uniref:SUN domain-containing protein n=1 Tax=Trametes pubescens TaxID=154538 RepID=A0A1M2V4N2_TRAPU|nr:hypothetical protein TRAPUB_6892 [Trametes pubescens]